MESIQDILETSQDIQRFYRGYEKSNTSNINLEIATDDAGIIDIEETAYNKQELEKSSLKLYKESILHKDSSLTKPSLTYFQKAFGSNINLEYFHLDKTLNRFSLKFSKEVEVSIINDSIFRKFISQVEKGLNDFFNQENIVFNNILFFEEDWEIPDYKKLVLSLNFKGISFKQELILWKKVTDLVYNRIKFTILNSSNEKAKDLKELKKKIFIKLEM